MKWATSKLVHFDRAASAWLIARFIDAEAEFVFLADAAHCPPGATPFGLKGVRLAAHDGAATTFRRILDAFAVDDAALDRFERLISAGVSHVLHDREADALGRRDPLTGGVLALAEGAMLLSSGDAECLKRSFVIYEALYARLQVEPLLQTARPATSVMVRTLAFAHGVAAMRGAGAAFSPEAFQSALESLA